MFVKRIEGKGPDISVQPTYFSMEFSVCRFTDNITKDGDTVKYTINVRKIEGSGDIITITRKIILLTVK